MSVDDMASESWILAIEIGQRRGWTFDFGDQDDQDTLLAWMHNKFVKYAEKAVRYAIKLTGTGTTMMGNKPAWHLPDC